MQNSILKLTALVGVAAVGFLCVLQAQRGLENASGTSNDDILNNLTENQYSASPSAGGLQSSSATDSAFDEGNGPIDSTMVQLGQNEPFPDSFVESNRSEPSATNGPTAPVPSEGTSSTREPVNPFAEIEPFAKTETETQWPTQESFSPNNVVLHAPAPEPASPTTPGQGLDFREVMDGEVTQTGSESPSTSIDNNPDFGIPTEPPGFERKTVENTPKKGSTDAFVFADDEEAKGGFERQPSKAVPEKSSSAEPFLLDLGKNAGTGTSPKPIESAPKPVTSTPELKPVPTSTDADLTPTPVDDPFAFDSKTASDSKSATALPLEAPNSDTPAFPIVPAQQTGASDSKKLVPNSLSPFETREVAAPAESPFAETESADAGKAKSSQPLTLDLNETPPASVQNAPQPVPLPLEIQKKSETPATKSESLDLDFQPKPQQPQTIPDASKAIPIDVSTDEPAPSANAPDAGNAAVAIEQQSPITQVALRPELKIKKIAPDNAILGEPMIYSIVVKNQGKANAQQVVVEDQVPKGVNLIGTIPRAEMSSGTLIWRLGTLKPDDEKLIRVKIVPKSEGEIGSVATVNFVSEITSKTVVTAPKLHLDLSAPSQVRLGEKLVVEFKIENSGTSDAKDVWLRDIIPEGLSHPGGNDMEYEIGDLAAGKSRTITLALTAVRPGKNINKAVVTAEGGITTEAKLPVEVVGSLLSISRTGPKRRFVGRPAVYTNTVKNDTNVNVAGITVTETVPAGMEFSEATNGGVFSPTERTVTWRLNKLNAKATKDLRVTMIPKSTGSKSSTVRVSDDAGNTVKIQSATEVQGIASLAVDLKEIEGVVAKGDQVSIRLRVRNRGTSADSNVSLTLTIPEELSFILAHAPVKYSVSGREVKFQPIGKMAAQEEVTFDVVLTAIKKGDARLKIAIQSDARSKPLTREESIVIFADDDE